MTDLPENVTEALAPETFDVLSFVSGAKTPLDKVTIYTNGEAGFRLAEIAAQEARNADLAETEGFGIADEVEWADEDEVEELRQAVENSAITFELRGLAPKAKTAIRQSLVAKHNYKESEPAENQEEYFSDLTYTLIAKTISSVTNAFGAVDNRKWTPEQVSALRDEINEAEFGRLDQAVYNVNYNTDIFDRAANADFLSKR